MQDSALFPPTYAQLSDVAISSVLQRARRNASPQPNSGRSFYPVPGLPLPESELPPTPQLSSATTAALNTTLSRRKRCQGDSTTTAASKQIKPRKTRAKPADPKDEQVELRRQRNRVHQARHKKKQRQFVADLEASIKTLKKEIQELKLQRQLVSYVPSSSTIWGVAVEFFRLFQHSVRRPMSLTTQQVDPMWCSDFIVQRNFMRATMAADVTDGAVVGLEGLLQTWTMQSVCYEEIDLQPVRLERGPDDSLVAATEGTLTMNGNTLRYAFPHLIDGHALEEWRVLADKMLGQKLALRGSVVFKWDSASSCVTSVECKADILTPLLHLLGNLDDVSCVFEGARVTPEGRLVSSELLRVL